MTEYRGPLFWFDPTPGERVRAWLKFVLWWKPLCLCIPVGWLLRPKSRWQAKLATWAFSWAWLQNEIAAGRAR